MQRYPEAAGVLHGAQVEDLGAVGGQLQGLLAGEGLDALGGGDDAGVGGEQAVDVGVDLADVGVEGGGQGDGGGVGAAASRVVVSSTSLMPWKPATMATAPVWMERATRSGSTPTMEALPYLESVRTPAWAPV